MIKCPPKYTTNQPAGLGFAEMVDYLVRKKKIIIKF
jgi:hypothetical protein